LVHTLGFGRVVECRSYSGDRGISLRRDEMVDTRGSFLQISRKTDLERLLPLVSNDLRSATNRTSLV